MRDPDVTPWPGDCWQREGATLKVAEVWDPHTYRLRLVRQTVRATDEGTVESTDWRTPVPGWSKGWSLVARGTHPPSGPPQTEPDPVDQQVQALRDTIAALEAERDRAQEAERRARGLMGWLERRLQEERDRRVRAEARPASLDAALLRRLITFAHPDKHQRAAPAVQAEATALTALLLVLRKDGA